MSRSAGVVQIACYRRCLKLHLPRLWRQRHHPPMCSERSLRPTAADMIRAIVTFRNMLIPLGGHPPKRQFQPREYSDSWRGFQKRPMRQDSLNEPANVLSTMASGWLSGMNNHVDSQSLEQSRSAVRENAQRRSRSPKNDSAPRNVGRRKRNFGRQPSAIAIVTQIDASP